MSTLPRMPCSYGTKTSWFFRLRHALQIEDLTFSEATSLACPKPKNKSKIIFEALNFSECGIGQDNPEQLLVVVLSLMVFGVYFLLLL